MDCDRFWNEVLDARDVAGAISADSALRSHLACCDRCRGEMAMMGLLEKTRPAPAQEHLEELTRNICAGAERMRASGRTAAHRRFVPAWLAWATIPAAAILLAGVLVPLFGESGSEGIDSAADSGVSLTLANAAAPASHSQTAAPVYSGVHERSEGPESRFPGLDVLNDCELTDSLSAALQMYKDLYDLGG